MPETFSSLNVNIETSLSGSHHQTVSITPADTLQLRFLSHCAIGSSDYETNHCNNIRTIPPLKEHVLDDSAISDISWMYE